MRRTATGVLRQLGPQLRRQVHTRVALPYAIEDGLSPFLSQQALKTIAVDWQDGVLKRLTDLVRESKYENLSVVQTVIETSSEPTQALAFNYASEALNNSFFLSTLTPTPVSLDPSSNLSQALERSPLGSFEGLVSHFAAHVSGLHPSSGAYVWLATNSAGELGVIGTYAGGTILVRNRQQALAFAGSDLTAEAKPENTAEPLWKPGQSLSDALSASRSGKKQNNDLYPLVALSTHEHCYLADYGVWGREKYTQNWFNSVNWSLVEKYYDNVVTQ